MINSVSIYIGSIIITLWGIAHITPTRSIVKGFGEISVDNRRIITMEWIAEGLTFIFIGLLVFLVTYLGESHNYISHIVYKTSAVMLIIMAILSIFTGARVAIVPMRICPIVKICVTALFFLGSVL